MSETLILDRLAASRPEDQDFLIEIIENALQVGNLEVAAEFAARHASLTRDVLRPTQNLTLPKIRHDIEQFRHLRAKGLLGSAFDPTIEAYDRTLEKFSSRGDDVYLPLEEVDEETVNETIGRIIHLRPTPRIEGGALSDRWNRQETEETYLSHPLGLVVIDGLLSEAALAELRNFCLESTIWFGNHYAQGRLGAFFREGFNCPLLMQVAEEIRDAFPRVIGRRHPLLEMWGYRYDKTHRRDVPHADFAAVNVNFWIAPDSANLDPDSGGLVIYDLEAPSEWDFQDYNASADKILPLIEERKPRAIEIPYRENRAVIFNSDLFHVTADCRFRDGFLNQRTNVTMLYGERNQT